MFSCCLKFVKENDGCYNSDVRMNNFYVNQLTKDFT